MLNAALDIAIVAIVLAMFMNLWRVARGPLAEDRILALDTLYINTIGLVVMLSIGFDSRLYFEVALLIAMMGFVGTIALAKYLLRGNLMD